MLELSPVNSTADSVPDWDREQLEVILETSASWQIVIAGPGAGKSAVACQRIAYLVDAEVPASRILLISFTRTAVAEIRNRIISYAVAGGGAGSVRISTIDSHAWSLRAGFHDESISKSLGDGSYDLNIQRTIELFRSQNQDLLDFMASLEHLIIDEAQDVMGLRAELVMEMLKALSPNCGVTILADPAQAIYGFTTDDADGSKLEQSLLERLGTECPRPLLQRTLKSIHRIKDRVLFDLFIHTRREIELAESASGHVTRVQQTIREMCGNDVGAMSFEKLADFLSRVGDASMLVLFRRRADVIVASSYCSKAKVEHRLRLSDSPIIVRPWLGWLLGETVQAILDREDFDKLWDSRVSLCSAPFMGEQRDACWALLHRLCAGSRPRTLDLVHLRNIVARARPPIELCYTDFGTAGPILGTIHASKGREADSVVLVMPRYQSYRDGTREGSGSAAFEEGRVYYVGATRARHQLTAAHHSAPPVEYLDSGRVYRIHKDTVRAQVQVGREGDIDRLAHLAWSNSLTTQRILAAHAGRTVPVRARAVPEHGYALRVLLEQREAVGKTQVREIGQLSNSFRAEFGKVWSKIDPGDRLKPSEFVPHLYLAAVATVGLTEHERDAVRPPFSQSALALAPVIKGFPMIRFFPRTGRSSR